jgi:hypothetical protein
MPQARFYIGELRTPEEVGLIIVSGDCYLYGLKISDIEEKKLWAFGGTLEVLPGNYIANVGYVTSTQSGDICALSINIQAGHIYVIYFGNVNFEYNNGKISKYWNPTYREFANKEDINAIKPGDHLPLSAIDIQNRVKKYFESKRRVLKIDHGKWR